MKGSITACMQELVVSKFGQDKWDAVLEDSGLKSKAMSFGLPTADIPDGDVMSIYKSIIKVLGISATQAADAFGEQWVCEYAPKVFKLYYLKFKNARDMITGMDDVHINVTNSTPNAHPPRFDYNWDNDKTLTITYKSKRDMIDIYVGLLKAVGKYYKEKLNVTKLSASQVRVEFA